MSEWGRYFKNAVANVEQTLDKVLLEEKPKPEPVEAAVKSAGAQDTLVTPKPAIVPDLHPAVSKAQKLALAVHSDAALELLDLIEAASKELDAYVHANTEKLLAAQQKLKLVTEPGSFGDDKDAQIKQLVNEGQQLAQQELKLNLLVKQLRSEKQQLQTKAASLTKQVQDTESLQTQLQKAQAQAAEFEALAGHYKQNANETVPASTELAPQLELERAARKHDRDAAAQLESKLLARIADLEQLAKTRLSSVTELQSLLSSAQQDLLSARNTAVELGDELSRLKEECDKLNKLQELQEIQAEQEQIDEEDVENEAIEVAKEENGVESVGSSPVSLLNEDVREFQFGSPLHDPYTLESPLPEPVHPFAHGDESALSLESLRNYSVGSCDTLEALDTQRRFSDGEPESAPPRVVHELTLKIRKLERELANAKRAEKMKTAQTEAAQTDLARLIDADEQLEVLQRQYDAQLASDAQLKAELADLQTQNARKEELISELEADVEDVKMAYKQQILDLVAELEAKSAS